jgi:hypothetical protein
VAYTYDLNDGVGEQTYNNQETSITLSKAAPILNIGIEVFIPVVSFDSIYIELDYSDEDSVITLFMVQLYDLNDNLIDELDYLGEILFSDLNYATDYDIEIYLEYNLNDGIGNIKSQKVIYENIATLPFRGEGNEQNPFMIDFPEQFKYIESYSSSYFELTNDLDFEGINFVPIQRFYGTIDGKNYKLSNIYYEEEFQDSTQVGIFRNLDNNGLQYGILKNIFLLNIHFKIFSDNLMQNNGHFGLLVGYSSGLIQNITGSGKLEISAKSYFYGSITGYNNGIIENSEVTLEYIDYYEGTKGFISKSN